MKIQVNDLVMVRINENSGSFRAWIRVKFIDLNKIFYGKIELVDKDCTQKIGDVIKLNNKEAIDNFSSKDGKQWCYYDRVTRCDCPGLCRNK